jgi:hypothetical protein
MPDEVLSQATSDLADVIVLIPTCSDDVSDIRIGYTLTSPALQDCGAMSQHTIEGDPLLGFLTSFACFLCEHVHRVLPSC